MLLDVQGVTKIFTGRKGTVTAVDDVSLQVRRGECFGLIGESGSGKSTLASIIAGTLAPTSGTVELDGQLLDAKSARSRRRHQLQLQMVFQDPRGSFNPRMRVAEALAEPLKYKLRRDPAARADAIGAMLERVKLPESILRSGMHSISVGQAQRVGIARALLAEASLILCDEITSALDVTVQASILELLRELRQEHELSMLFISHDIAVVAQIADRVAVMESGRLIEQGETTQVLRKPSEPYTKMLIELS